LQISAEFAFDNGVATHHARAAQVAFGREMKIAARANTAAEVGGNLVITQIDVSAATGTISGGGRLTYFVFPFALKARNQTAALPAPEIFDFPKTGWLRGGGGLLFGVEL
jgi:hypothetical protein